MTSPGNADRPPAPLIVLEGIDGSGKGTHAELLARHVTSLGISVAPFSFPRYRQTFFGARVGEFLNGEFGALDELDPFLISLLYAGDRLESRADLLAARRDNGIVICDRYVPSNIAHQSAKRCGDQRRKLRDWIDHVEYSLNQLPRPDHVVLLDIPVELSQLLIARKSRRSYTDRTADLQEADTRYMQGVREVYLELARSEPDWTVVPVAAEGELRSIEDIQHEVQAAVAPLISSASNS